jgi:hypothetical protein
MPGELAGISEPPRAHRNNCRRNAGGIDRLGNPQATELVLLIDDLKSLIEGHEPFTPWGLFDGTGVPAFACLIDPPSLDLRIMAQSAAFTLCSSKTQSLDQFLAGAGLDDALRRFVIPAEFAGRVRDQLDLVGISERHLFPDLDGVAAELHRYYS